MVKPESELTLKDLEVGTIMTEGGTAAEYETGDWKSQSPILDKSKCNKCGLCYIFCPEGCIEQNEEEYFIANLFYCKGCGICAIECPKKAIEMAEEEEK
ncbi:4Fe-4S binding protein [Chloroflexota bacterium]